MIYVRGQPEDFDHWAQLGNRGWSWDDVLPFFKRAEKLGGEADAVHGKGGPLFTSRGATSRSCVRRPSRPASSLGLGIPRGRQRSGAGDTRRHWLVQHTRAGRRRASAAHSYLRPALKRPNLRVVTHALVHRVVLDGGRAVGVEIFPQRLD